MDLLLRHGITPDVAVFGQTALHFAAAWHGDISDAERARFAAMLLDYGARLDVRDEMLQSTPLGWACRWGRGDMAALLIARGAPIVEPDAEPWATPMAWAKKMNHRHILAMLARDASAIDSCHSEDQH
jgi:ankyrin repeat protein